MLDIEVIAAILIANSIRTAIKYQQVNLYTDSRTISKMGMQIEKSVIDQVVELKVRVICFYSAGIAVLCGDGGIGVVADA